MQLKQDMQVPTIGLLICMKVAFTKIDTLGNNSLQSSRIDEIQYNIYNITYTI